MIIGFTGFKQSGKDTCANYLVQLKNFTQYSFASPLKEGVKAFFGWTDAHVNDSRMKEEVDEFYGVSPRLILQLFGTEVMREVIPSLSPEFKDKMGKNFWVKRFEQFYSKNKDKNIVISDVRFENEVEIIKQLGGVVIKVSRDSVVPKVISHPSENIGLLKVDYVLDNNEDIKHLTAGLKTLLKDMNLD